jgi:hypothetical protein
MNIFVNEDLIKLINPLLPKILLIDIFSLFFLQIVHQLSSRYIYTPTESGCLVESEKMVMGLCMWDFGVPQANQV